jgi:DNA-binding XRE family transcriptional regulator
MSERKPGTVLRDLRRHYLLATQQDLAEAADLSKRTVKRVEYREPAREKTQLAIVRGLDQLLTRAFGEPIRLAVGDIFDNDNKAILGVDRDLPVEERAMLRADFVAELLSKRVRRKIVAE